LVLEKSNKKSLVKLCVQFYVIGVSPSTPRWRKIRPACLAGLPIREPEDLTAQSLKSKGAWIALAASAIAFAAVLIATNQDRNRPEEPEPDIAGTEEASQPKGPIGKLRDGFKDVGGVYRPESDVNFAKRDETRKMKRKPLIDPGLSPAVQPDANPQVASVYEALKSRKNPERFSSFVRPPEFDRTAYKADPDTYINTIEPGRVFQSAQPGPDIKRIQAVSARYQRVTQGEQVPMVVQATPDAPVTFTSFNLGHFENQLTSITVKADAEGKAAARYTAAKGTVNDVSILAASPMTSAQAEFRLLVKLPKPDGEQIAKAAP